MKINMTKAELYTRATQIRRKLHLRIYEPVDIVDVMKYYMGLNETMFLEIWPFKNKSIGGIIIIGENSNTMILNKRRTIEERRFDWAHELMHYYLHADKEHPVFNCIDINKGRALSKEDAIIEWQANEGAAEMLMPYIDFIPMLLITFKKGLEKDPYMKYRYHAYVTDELSAYYGVSKTVVDYRIESLTCETYQYLAGIGLKDIKILSHAQQKRMGFNVKSIYPYLFNEECLNCALNRHYVERIYVD